MAFGVPVAALPVTYEGEVKLAAHSRWISKRCVKEKQIQQGRQFHGMDLPGVNDGETIYGVRYGWIGKSFCSLGCYIRVFLTEVCHL